MVGTAVQEEKSVTERPSSPCSTRCLRYPDVEVTMFCPQCKAEYRASFVRCSDCDVELVDHLPVQKPTTPPMPRSAFEPDRFEAEPELVVVRTYQTGLDADLAKSV